MTNIVSLSEYIVQVYGKSNLVAETITRLRRKKRRQIFANIFLGSMLLNDICFQKPLRKNIKNLKYTKWHSIVTKLVDILEKNGYWCFKPKDIIQQRLKQATRNEIQLRNC